MTAPRFLQIHTLTSYAAALLNRDDSGLAKRLPYGDALRTRISSQCLKRHWRLAEDPHALARIDGAEAAFRSRELVTLKVIKPLRDAGIDGAVVDALEPEFQMALYGDKGVTKKSRQTLIFGETELRWLAAEAARLADEAGGDAKAAKTLAEAWRKGLNKSLKAMTAAASLPGGLTSALFGRMVTSDPEANITAPVHVAHAFTVHAEEAESDYFTAVDDLSGDEPGADTIQETELTSGLFYGYVVVDIPGLIDNLGGDADLAGRVLHNLVYLIAEVSPGAKRGSTAPYGRAGMVLLEAGDRQPRSLAEAFRTPCPPHLGPAAQALTTQLEVFDRCYETGEERHVLSLANAPVPGAAPASLRQLAEWAGGLPAQLSAGRAA
ncbi:type I-E CRISPR-associated protein Cas7/Cas4/CasC [Paracoccus yeei]|uniref:Type I-E CRISPR-associated protein Cas7/Cas4/CasC n=1 Tax=Paracoccus yeei TaxID=147645 RepID=A0A386UMQ7_9RHOB|nr:type I-E CRISPR-associated protein Cas7/Cse4/CasC [Paracoccus yeei]AYF01851.1 type I-E CRISPR-associated protein Cas7/Cas4/CasC [Paracoccus yeei]